MSGFGTASAALKDAVNSLETIANAVARPVESWLGLAGTQHEESLQALSNYLRGRTGALVEAADTCTAQAGFDEQLAKAPTPQDVFAAKATMLETQELARVGQATTQQLALTLTNFEKTRDERDAAVEAHKTATEGTCFDQDHPLPPSLGTGEYSSRPGADIVAESLGTPNGASGSKSGGLGEMGTDNDDATAGDTGLTSQDATEASGDTGHTPDTSAPATAPSSPTAPSTPTSGTSTPPLSDTSDAASTGLSTDSRAVMTPQAGSLGGVMPMQQQPQQMVGGGAPGFTTAGGMIGQPQQANPNQQRGVAQQHRDKDGKMTLDGLQAVMTSGTAAAVVPVSTGGAGVSPVAGGTGAPSVPPTAPTAPSGAPATPAAPQGGSPQGGSPLQQTGQPASGAAPIGMMGAGNTTRGQNAAVAPKEPKPSVDKELMERVSKAAEEGNDKKKAS